MPRPSRRRQRLLADAALRHGAARGWRIELEPQTLRIQTIDSFNYWLASQLPVASRAGGALQVTEGAAELCQRAARRTLLVARLTTPVGTGELSQIVPVGEDGAWRHPFATPGRHTLAIAFETGLADYVELRRPVTVAAGTLTGTPSKVIVPAGYLDSFYLR